MAGSHTAREVNQDCVNVLTLTRATATVLMVTEPQTLTCEAGTVTFTRRGPRLAYHWLDINKLAQNTGILRKGALSGLRSRTRRGVRLDAYRVARGDRPSGR